MPIDYHISRDEGVIFAGVQEPTTLAHLRSYVATTAADPAYSPDLVEVIDVGALKQPDGAEAAFDAAYVIARVGVRRRVRARAIVAPTALLFALARNYQQQTADIGVPTRVFRDAGSAVAWAHHVVAQAPRRLSLA